MNLSPVQTLRDRLQAVMVAGAPLAADDFRLARELEQFAPYEKAAPVFARLGQVCRALQTPDCPDRAGALLDAISLADAVLCTQAAVEAPGQPEAVEGQGTQAVLAWAPYSVLSPLIQALTTSKEGGYNLVMETHENHPELFADYRVQEALVKALGGNYPDPCWSRTLIPRARR